MYKFENLQNKPLVERVADNIKDYIVDNQLAIGTKIPNEYELAEKLGVGRSTIRESIKILVSQNILEVRRGAGTFVSEGKGIVADPLGLSIIKDRHNLALDLLAVRLMLEPEIAGLAAEHATEEDIQSLDLQCLKVAEMIRNELNHTEEDIKFHTCIAKCSKNIVVENLIPIINSSVAMFANITHRKLTEETLQTHREITDAIKAHDPETAKYAMTMHLVYNRRMILKIIKEAQQKAKDL